MADRTWKAFERRMARLFGTERIPAAGCLGKAQKNAPDFQTGLVAFQAKKGYNPPSYLREWLDGIVFAGKHRGRFGAVVWSGKNGRDSEAFVVMRASDFAALLVPAEGFFDKVTTEMRAKLEPSESPTDTR